MHYYVKCQGQSEDIRNFVSTSTDTMILSSDCKSDKDLYPVVTLNTYDVTHKKSKTPHFFHCRLAKSFEVLNSSRALSAPEIFLCKDTCKLLVFRLNHTGFEGVKNLNDATLSSLGNPPISKLRLPLQKILLS